VTFSVGLAPSVTVPVAAPLISTLTTLVVAVTVVLQLAGSACSPVMDSVAFPEPAAGLAVTEAVNEPLLQSMVPLLVVKTKSLLIANSWAVVLSGNVTVGPPLAQVTPNVTVIGELKFTWVEPTVWLKSSNCQAVVMTSVIGDAKITNLCQSVNLVGINLVIRAGRGSNPVHATNLVLDSTDLSGDANFTNIQIGRDAHDLTEDSVKGNPYTFGQQADSVDIDHVRQDSYATTASTFSLPGLSMSFQSEGC
jgi:hypothetical protein